VYYYFLIDCNADYSDAASLYLATCLLRSVLIISLEVVISILILNITVISGSFDLTGTESGLVSGYNTELSGFYFGLFYLREYLHLFFVSNFVAIVFFGG
jgi:NADH:ubiquinone oxidoreductase subunit H